MPRPRISFGVALLVTTTLAMLFSAAFLLYSAVGPIAPASTIAQLQPGITEAEVERLFGRPTNVDRNGDWLYEKPYNPGWLCVKFDENRELAGYDHETVFH